MKITLLPVRMVALLTIVASLLAVQSEAVKTKDPFYIISHMANSQYSLDWSVKEGANAIEADILFDGAGNPYKFEHGGFCDCTCPHPSSFHICNEALGNSCSGSSASNDAVSHLRHLARLKEVALFIVDSKVEPKMSDRLRIAGTKIVELLQKNLFGAGYRGKVVISTGKINCFDYVYTAALEASRTPNPSQYYFSFDEEGNNYQDVTAMLSRFTKNRVYGTGISSCFPGNFENGISQAVSGVQSGQMGTTYIWTLDKETSMETYINLGVHGIITNRVGLLKQLATKMGLRLAKTGDKIPVAKADIPSPDRCDCDYHKTGGCIISFPPPAGKSCWCKYSFLWRCSGSVSWCDGRQEKCRTPDASRETCRFGGGDCGGYQ